MKFCVTKRPTTLQISPTKRKRQGPTKQQEKQFRTSRAPTVKRPVLERPAGISAQNCLNASGEWDHFIYSESAYITVVMLNCPCCNGKCVPKLNGINRMIDERLVFYPPPRVCSNCIMHRDPLIVYLLSKGIPIYGGIKVVPLFRPVIGWKYLIGIALLRSMLTSSLQNSRAPLSFDGWIAIRNHLRIRETSRFEEII